MIDRRSLTQKERTEMFMAQGGKCFDCGAKMLGGLFHADHRQALEHDGDNSLDNIKLICIPCHKAKTKADHQDAAKRDRIIVGGRQRKGPPMPGTKASGLRKRMDGTVERRS